ncbi:MAG: PAS domain-containing protein [Bdellovibrionales bacterium]|nr:PAS domain-containing protein [Bdellovibrionales bacterium]
MAIQKCTPTGIERTFGDNEIIVSKTDLKGRITYANDVFLRVAGFLEEELIGQQHNIIRHPAMPRCVFQFLWDTIQTGQEIFAYVVNMCKGGDHYWVFAHVTPTFDADGQIIGYHSNRRVPMRESIRIIEPFYAKLVEIENSAPDRKQGLENATNYLLKTLSDKNMEYGEFVFAISHY